MRLSPLFLSLCDEEPELPGSLVTDPRSQEGKWSELALCCREPGPSVCALDALQGWVGDAGQGPGVFTRAGMGDPADGESQFR